MEPIHRLPRQMEQALRIVVSSVLGQQRLDRVDDVFGCQVDRIRFGHLRVVRRIVRGERDVRRVVQVNFAGELVKAVGSVVQMAGSLGERQIDVVGFDIQRCLHGRRRRLRFCGSGDVGYFTA
ncbi:hypothetical protein [Streptomyces sp. NPDC014995]|uniref:hypothetical protein n=1 Tax=Streptomyces sp. NPDC014995 TaxID=3364936 RepID=UPI0036FDD8D3